MKDYYKILGLDRGASSEEVKNAYKTLALKYHPDRNKGSKFTEEQFKNINEAYQILSDEYKKEKYDLVQAYSKKSSHYQPFQTYTNTSKEERPYYERYGKFDWRNTPRYAKARVYKIDKNYYRIQRYTIVVLLLAFILGTSGNAIFDHYEEKRVQEEIINIQNQLQQAEQFFNKGEYDSTFQIILGLIQQYPAESEYSRYRNEYVIKINDRGRDFYFQQDYIHALAELNAAKDYIRNQDLNIWLMIGECHKALKSYQKAIDAFDYVFIREPENIELASQIGDLYLTMNDKENALSYFTLAKNIFKQRQSSIYGKAFELVIKPNLLDTAYFHIFKKRGQLNYELSEYNEAATDYNWAIFLNSEYISGYGLRAECWLKLGNTYRACLDWREAYQQGDRSVLSKIRQYCGS